MKKYDPLEPRPDCRNDHPRRAYINAEEDIDVKYDGPERNKNEAVDSTSVIVVGDMRGVEEESMVGNGGEESNGAGYEEVRIACGGFRE